MLRCSKSRGAAVALVTALSLPVLIGAAGFAADAAFWFAQHSALQSATDAGALAAARQLQTTPSTSAATLQSTAVSAANAASNNQFHLTAASLTLTSSPGDPRQVVVNANAPAKLFFSPGIPRGAFNIATQSTAGVNYSVISTQATCQALDSFTYLYSTGFGTLETAHSSGIDPYTCGGQPQAAPAPTNAFCNAGILTCSLGTLGSWVGGGLLPVAFQVEPTSAGSKTLATTLSSALGTVGALLGGDTNTTTGSPAVFQVGSSSCTTTGYNSAGVADAASCTIAAGVYPGGIIIGPGVTFTLTSSAATGDYFVMLNGNLVISTQAKISSTSYNPYIFFFAGLTPGAFVMENQVQVNVAPVSSGVVAYKSIANFSYSSVLGAQISAPLSEMGYAEQQGETSSAGLLGNLGLPGGNLLGSNFESVESVCLQATSFCTTGDDVQGPQHMTTLIPSADGATAPVTTLVSDLGSTPLSSVASAIVGPLGSSGLVSTTTFTSAVALKNGTPTDWSQTETESAALDNTPPLLSQVVGLINNLLTSLLNGLLGLLGLLGLESNVDIAAQAVWKFIGTEPQNVTGTSTDYGVFPGQVSTNANPSCAANATNLYSGTATITPNFGPTFTNLLSSSTAAGESLSVTTSDNIVICGTESQAVNIDQIFPGTKMTSSTAAGASTLALIK